MWLNFLGLAGTAGLFIICNRIAGQSAPTMIHRGFAMNSIRVTFFLSFSSPFPSTQDNVEINLVIYCLSFCGLVKEDIIETFGLNMMPVDSAPRVCPYALWRRIVC